MSLRNTLLEGKVAIVSGGGRGIGGATSKTLGAAGAAVAVVDLVEERAKETALEIEAAGGQAIPVVADLLDSAQVEGIVGKTVSAFGGVDVLANIAGGAIAWVEFRRMIEWTEDEWDLIQDRNLRYVFLTCRAVIKQMLTQGRGGSIVNIASISGVVSAPNHAPYGAAKGGVIMLTKTLAKEHGPDNIRVNAVSPGSIRTPATQGSRTDQDYEGYRDLIPIGRVGEPEDIARAVLFFASDMAAYVTGQMLLVDGGASVNYPIGAPSSQVGRREGS